MSALRMALRSISANKLRSALTMLGIIIGVFALVVLVSLVSSATDSIVTEVAGLGSSLLSVSVSDDKGRAFKIEELEAWVDENPEIGAISPYGTVRGSAAYGKESDKIDLLGVSGDYCSIAGKKMLYGRFIKRPDLTGSTLVCVLDQKTAKKLIGFEDCVGEKISINNIKFEVIGVTESQENLASMLFTNMTAYVPYTTLVRVSKSVLPAVSSFYITPEVGYSVSKTEDLIREMLIDRFEKDKDAFYLTSQNVLERAMKTVKSVLAILFGGIAGISLIVGGVGIMNIMLVTVTERTREIGIRKAIGANRRTILIQFLIESVVLCMLGCGLGILFSWAVLQVASVIVASTKLVFHIKMNVVLLSVLFCFLIGVVFGLYPANKAAKLKPIDALHYGG